MSKRASLQNVVKLFFVVFTSIFLSACSKNDVPVPDEAVEKTAKVRKLHILVSNPLAGLFGKLKRQFAKEEPEITVSISTATESSLGNKVKTGRTNIDFIASTDYRVLQKDLLAEGLSNFVTIFATDEMVVAWSKQSTLSDKITRDNWQWIVSRKEVTFGHANSETDTCGLRTLLLWRLADSYYRSKVKGKTIEELMLAPSGKKIVRPSVLQLLPLLSTGTVDYVFTYRSIAEQHNLPYVRLRKKINLSDFKQKRTYASARHKGHIGEVISIAFTMSKDRENKTESGLFGNYILSDKGRALINESGFKAISGGATIFTTGTLDQPIGR